MSNAHRVRLKESTIGGGKNEGGIVIYLSCPSGCFSGYLWGADHDELRYLAEEIVQGHWPDSTIRRVTYPDDPGYPA